MILHRLQDFHADLTAADPATVLISFQRLRFWTLNKLTFLPYSGQPETVLVVEEKAGSPSAIAFYERSGTKIFQA